MSAWSSLLDRVVTAHLALAAPIAAVLLLAVLLRARPATRASLASALALTTLLPWITPVIADPGVALANVRTDVAFTLGRSMTAGPESIAWWDVMWLAGSALALAWIGVGWVAVRRRLATMSPPARALVERVDGLARELGIAAPRILVCGTMRSPAVLCAPSPVLVVPRSVLRAVADDSLDGLLLHELAHLRRRDQWLRAVAGAACMLGWWNPLVWALRAVVREGGEQAADAWVIARRPELCADYAQGLLIVQRAVAADAVSTPALAIGALSPSGKSLKRRIERLFGAARPRSSAVAVGALCAVVGVACAVDYLAVQVSARPGAAASRPPRDLARSLARALIALEGETRPELLDEYVRRLRTAESADERRRAADDLGNLFEDASTAVPVLVEALERDASASVRREAADALGRIGPDAVERARPQLTRALTGDPEPRVQREAADVLARFERE